MNGVIVRSVRGTAAVSAYIVAVWFGILFTHEAGHVLHALVSGGQVERVTVPVWGFSRTDLGSNPRPVFVAWGGFVWGVGFPILIAGLVGRCLPGIAAALRGFAAAALIGNGVYACGGVGDVEDIVRAGGWRWPLVVYGLCSLAAGVYLLRRVGGTLRSVWELPGRSVVGVVAVAAALVGVAIALTDSQGGRAPAPDYSGGFCPEIGARSGP